jgi:hypothetical protein
LSAGLVYRVSISTKKKTRQYSRHSFADSLRRRLGVAGVLGRIIEILMKNPSDD